MLANLKAYAIDGKPAGTAYGRVKLDDTRLYWKSGLRRYAVELSKVRRAYRQEENVYGKLCCGGRSYVIHRLVLHLEDGKQLTIHIGDDARAEAQALLATLKEQPHIAIGKE